MEIDWPQIGLTLFGMVVVSAGALGGMRNQLKSMRELVAMVSEQLQILKRDTERDREMCESRCAKGVTEAKTHATHAHDRISEHISKHPGRTDGPERGKTVRV